MNWGMQMDVDDHDDSGIAPIATFELFRIREDMLRGCVGLDVTSFCVMLLGCLSNCFDKLYKNEDRHTDSDFLWESWFDFACIVNVLNYVLLEESSSEADGGRPGKEISRLSC